MTRVMSEIEAVLLAESSVCDALHWASPDPPMPRAPDRNASGGALTVLRGEDVAHLVHAAREDAEKGRRVAVVAPAHAVAGARRELRTLVSSRLPVVVHAVGGAGRASSGRDLVALLDLGLGALFPSGAEDALDMTLVARRAAEDCSVPFLVVHEIAPFRSVETVRVPDARAFVDYVGPAIDRLSTTDDPSHALFARVPDRVFAERVPFALGSALRDLEAYTGRRHDVLERVPDAGARPQGRGHGHAHDEDAEGMLVGLGVAGDGLCAVAEYLREQGVDVGAVRLSGPRPYPGARLAKTLARALAVTVFEPEDEVLAQSGPLTRELKAAFADAITWAPGYPGIGRIPRITSAACERPALELGHGVLAADNMLAGEHARRSLLFTADPDRERSRRVAGTRATVRAVVSHAGVAEACADPIARAVALATGLRVAAVVRRSSALEGHGYVLDVTAAPDRPRAALQPLVLDGIVLQTGAMLKRDVLIRLADGAPVHVTGATSAEITPPADTLDLVRERRLALHGAPSAPELLGATIAAIAAHLSARLAVTPVTPVTIARAIGEVLGADASSQAEKALAATARAV